MTIPAQSIFGINVSLDISNAADPILHIHLKDFLNISDGGNIEDGVGLDSILSISSENLDQWASKIFGSMCILHQQKQPETNVDATNGSYITHDSNFDRNFITRDGTGQIEYLYRVTFYTNDSVPNLDPDSVV